MRILLILSLMFLPLASSARKEGQARIDSLLASLPLAKSDTDRAKFLNNIASEYSIVNADEGLKYSKQALDASTAANFTRGIAMAHYNFAMNYDTRGDLASAIEHYSSALNLFEKLGLRRESAVVLTSIAVLYNGQGERKKAKEMLLRAIAIKEELGQTTETAYDLSTLADIYTRENDSASALRYARRAEALYKKMGLHYELGNLYSTFANAHANGQNFLRALEYNLLAMAEYKVSGNLQGQIITAGNIGGVYLAMAQNYPENFDDAGFSREFGSGLVPVGKAANARKAIEYFEKAIQIARETDALGEVMEFSEALSVAYGVTGDDAKALDAYKQFTIAKDSLMARANTEQLALLETKFETREKDKQIASQQKQLEYNRNMNLLLGFSTALMVAIGILVYANQRRTARLNRQITLQKAELEQLNAVKDRMFSVISHDLRTPVNSLITFTQLLEHGDLPQEKLKGYTATLKNTLGTTAGLMENLLNWARTQMQGYKPVPERFDLADTAQKVAALMATETNKKGLQLVNNVAPGSIVTADLNMTELLLRNLVSNAIKYTPAGGMVALDAARTGSYYHLTVRDTGQGMPAAIVEAFNMPGGVHALESTPGTNKEKGTGLGLMLCKSFAALMNGRITVKSDPGTGSIFTVEIPAG